MANLYGVVDSFDFTYLCADPQGADIISVPAEPAHGVVARGTVMYRKSNGQYAPAAASNCTAENQLVVLDEDLDTTASVAEVARVYRAGKLIAGKVKTADGNAVTEAIKVVLRAQGIVFEPAIL